MKMKKINNMGFTLIELLAVITIMGILMMVAIPAVSRTIENSRRDTFADNVRTYINTVRNAVLADELVCGTGDVPMSAQPDGVYYLKLCTADLSGKCDKQQTEDLMETVAKSSWGSAELYGYVVWNKLESKSKYEAYIVDSAKHGMSAQTAELSIKRTTIKTSGAEDKDTLMSTVPSIGGATAVECRLSK